MSAADAAPPALAPTVYLTSGCFVIAYDWTGWAGCSIPETQLKPNVQMNIAEHKFFLGHLLVRGKDENVVGSTEFFLYQRLRSQQDSTGVCNEYVLLHLRRPDGFHDYNHVNVMPVFVPICIAPTASMSVANFRVIASGSFGCALRITSGRGTFVVKVLDITEKSYKWVMREILFGYHLAQLEHPNIARLQHHYVSPNSVPPNNDFAAGSCVYFVQDDCGKSLIQKFRETFVEMEKAKKAAGIDPSFRCQPIPLPFIAQVLRGLLQALVLLEQQGILHRDIKSDNVLYQSSLDPVTNSELITTKLIDYGCARKHSSGSASTQGDDGVFSVQTREEEHSEGAADFQASKRFFEAGYPQFAPEVLYEQHPQFTYLSDLWAAGTMILWQMLFWGCEVNLRQSTCQTDRFFKFDLLKDHKHDYKQLKTAFPNEKFKQVVQQVLRNNYAAAKDSPESKQFNQLCDIFEFMSAPNPSHRVPAAVCLDMLTKAFPSATAAAAAAEPQPRALSTFNHVAHFIDSFCASGSVEVGYDVAKIYDEEKPGGFYFNVQETSGKVNITAAKYNPTSKKWSPSSMQFVEHEPQQLMDKQKPWLYVHKESSRYEGILGGCSSESGGSIQPAQLQRCFDRLKDSIEYPDYFVCPDADMKRGFFLPVNKFSFGLTVGESMLDAERLHLLSHGDWFTVFRYTPKASSEGCAHDSVIIKRTPINNSTFKYLLHEKTMLRYLSGSERIAVERLDGGFASLLVWQMNKGSYQNERFIAYQNGGRPLEVQFFKDNPPPPSIPMILQIAQHLLQALIFLFDKRVVHRNLNLGTVVFSEAGGAKLIALGSAKYINRLPYEERIRCFEGSSSPPQQQHDMGATLRGVKFGVGSSQNDPPTTTTNPEYFVHSERESSTSPAFKHDWFSVGRILEVLLKRAAPDRDQNVADLSAPADDWHKICIVSRHLKEPEELQKQLAISDPTHSSTKLLLEHCSWLLGPTHPSTNAPASCVAAHEISCEEEALLSFTQSLLRRRF